MVRYNVPTPTRELQSVSDPFPLPFLQTPISKSNAKKRMASDLLAMSAYLNELEQERLEQAELHESLIQSVEEMSLKKQKVLETVNDEHDSIEKEYRKAKAEYTKIKRERDALQAELDEVVTDNWKKHVHAIQASDWFSDYERGFF